MNRFILATGALLLLLPGHVSARMAKIKDTAHLFSAAAIQQAEDRLQEIKSEYRKDVVVSTFKKIPIYKDPWHKFPAMDASARDQFFRAWARSQTPGLEGISVLIYDAPPARYVFVAVGREVRAMNAFTIDDCDSLEKMVQASLAVGKNDQALLEALTFIRGQLNTRIGSVAPRPFDWPAITWITGGLLGAWLFAQVALALRGRDLRPVFLGVNPAGWGGTGNVWQALRAALMAPVGTPHSPETAAEEYSHPEPAHEQV